VYRIDVSYRGVDRCLDGYAVHAGSLPTELALVPDADARLLRRPTDDRDDAILLPGAS
jgi:hypothetical protein